MLKTDQKILEEIYPGSRVRGLETKIHIIECFMKCLSKHGIENISFEKIALIAKLPKAQIHYHFKSFYEILEVAAKVALARARAEVRANTEPDASFLDTLKQWTEANLNWAFKHPEWKAAFLLTIFRKGDTKESAKFVQDTLKPAYEALIPTLKSKALFDVSDEKLKEYIVSLQHHIMGIFVCHPVMGAKKLTELKKELFSHVERSVQDLIVSRVK